MPISYGRGLPPERVTHTYVDQHGQTRTFQAVETGTGRNWDVIDQNGVVWKNGITNASRWNASAALNQLAMEAHDARRHPSPSPRRDRVVGVDQGGNIAAAEILPRR